MTTPHEFVLTTDGTQRKICINCGKLESEAGETACAPLNGLLTTVHKGGVEVFDLWKHLGKRK